jgi:hypothetical protein
MDIPLEQFVTTNLVIPQQMNTPSTQMNKKYDMGNLIQDKTQLEDEAYALLYFLHS